MAEHTNIQWCDHSWSPWIGCSKVHTGCANCYAEADFDIRRQRAKWGANGTRVKTSDAYWKEPLGWQKHAAAGRCPDCKGRGHRGELTDDKQAHVGCVRCGGSGNIGPYRPRVFPSLCDIFEDWGQHIAGHQLVLDSRGHTLWRDEVTGEIFACGEAKKLDPCNARPRYLTLDRLRQDMFGLIDATPNLTWLLLTKRPENIGRMWPDGKRRGNCWLVYSASDQQSLETGLPHLLKCRDLVPVIGLSLEPLIGPIDLSVDGMWNTDCPHCADYPADYETGVVECRRCDATGKGDDTDINWVIVGGESGPNARPCNIQWIRSIVAQCKAANVPCFVKQLGACCIDDDPISRCSWPPLTQFRVLSVESGGRLHDEVILSDPKGGSIDKWPEDLRVRQLPNT